MSAGVGRVLKLAEQFEQDEGRRMHILVAKVGLDVYDRGREGDQHRLLPISASTWTSGRCSRRRPRQPP